MITDVATQINRCDMPKSTKANALALLLHVHPENGHAVVSWPELSEMFGDVDKRVARRHLGTMQKADLIHYSSNGDGLVYVNFKAWLAEKRALSTQNSCIEDTKNVHSEHENRALKTPTQNDENDGARVGARKTCTESTKNARGRALTYTHASARLNERTDPIQSIDEISSFIQPGPETEQARSFALLREVKVIQSEAATLAAGHPFERVRLCVAAFWMNRKSAGGKLKDSDPAIIVYWLKNWPRVEPNPFDERAWRREDLYLAHRTPEELAAELEPPPEPPPIVVPAVAQPPPAYLDDDPGWLAVAADTAAGDELAGLIEIGEVQGLPLYRLQAKDPTRAQYLDNRMAGRLRKVITGAIGCAVQVRIVGDDENQDPR